jgi:aldehyde dehydrogenase (NAD+)
MLSREGAAAVVRSVANRGLLIGGDRVASPSEGWLPHLDPATGEHHADVPLAGPAEIDAAVEAARSSLPVWQGTPLERRIEILHRLADLVVEQGEECNAINALDNGSPVAVLDSAAYSAQFIRYYAGWIDKLDGRTVPVYAPETFDYVVPEPWGVVGAIPPWNGPMMGMAQKAVAALAAGNTVVAKPPEVAPFGAIRFAELALEAGLPPGVLNVTPGGPVAGEALVRHPGVDKVSFTGGTATARSIVAAAADTLKPLALELGGKTANIVFPDADIDSAAGGAAFMGVCVLSGQGCALPTRLYVHDEVYDQVVERVVAQLETTRVGDPLLPDTMMGPVVNGRALERIIGVIDRARSEGSGKLLTGGHRLQLEGDLAGGYFIAPTVFGDVDHESELARNEIFGPVLSILRFSTEDEAVAKANDSPYGLSAMVHTRDLPRAQRMVRRLQAGTVIVNTYAGGTPTAPFGGYKRSGFGREGGRAGIDEFLQLKNVVVGG